LERLIYQGGFIVKKNLAITAVICFILFSAGELFAQCQVNLINYTEVKHIFKEKMCGEAMGRCYSKVASFQTSDPQHYAYAYCDAGVNKRVSKKTARCQSKDMVRCTIEWSDGVIDSYEEFCQGCTGAGSPYTLPCNWPCPFPQR
jgi:hypothetical protein